MSKKICLLVDSLSSGGAEKVAANMSISLNAKGYNVFLVSMINSIDYQYKGELYNFGLIKEKYTRLEAFFKFKTYFKEGDFEIIIDHRVRNKFFKELLFSKFVFRNNTVIYCLHNYLLTYYFSFLNIPWLAGLPHVKNKTFVSVCNEIGTHLEQKLKIKSRTIYNYLNFNQLSETTDYNKDSVRNYIIGVGRLTKIKQFDKLIKSYFASNLHKNGIKLFILGDGPEKESLEALISKLCLEGLIKLLPFTKNPYDLISNAKALVLTSKVEGFPMVLLEALSLNTPIIAFNCKSGPSEIIINEVNGLLVEDQNEEQLTMALNKLVDDSFYLQLKSNAHVGLDKFSEDIIVQQWINLLENRI